MWLVMKIRQWHSLEGYLDGNPIPVQVQPPDAGSLGFIEVFESREAALAAADGKAELVLQVKEGPK